MDSCWGNITSSSNVILDKTSADICVVGDGEKPFVKLLDYIKDNPNRDEINYEALMETKGLAFKDVNGELFTTGNAEQMTAPITNREKGLELLATGR